MSELWRGVIPAITTPFHPDYSIDHETFSKHVRWMADSGCTGVVLGGSLGEGGSLSLEEKAELIRTARAASKAHVILGVASLTTGEAVGIAKEDGVSHLKVRIYLKNRSARAILGITLTDRVPSIADVIKAESPGSITPSKIAVSEKGGTLLRWELEQLEPYEERVVTYLAKSKLRIIGRISMPTAKARFTLGDKERVVYSNNIEVVQRFKDR